MAYLDDIVAAINTKLDRTGDVNGIAQLMPRIRGKGEAMEILPALVSADGELKYLGPEDYINESTGNKFIQYRSYHRALNMPTRKLLGTGRGDSLGKDELTVNMVYVAYCSEPIANYTLAFQLHAVWPETVQGSIITLQDINLNSIQIYGEETANTVPFFLKPNQYLIKITYNIKSTFDRRCINL